MTVKGARADSISVHVPVKTLTISGRGAINGVISLRVGDCYFPEREWNDFPVVILKWWLDEMSLLWRGQQEDKDGIACAFMDGDFYFTVSERKEERWIIECVKGLPGERTGCAGEAGRLAIIREAISCASQVIDACRSRGWKTQEIDELAATVARVENEIVLQPAA